MNRLFYRLVALGLLLGAPLQSRAIVGYINYSFQAGDNLFQDNLLSTPDDLNTIFSALTTPVGTTISLWDPATLSYGTSSTWLGTQWTVDFTLDPGTGARLTTTTAFANTFVGFVEDRLGNTSGPNLNAGPPVFSGPNGVYLLGDKDPFSGITGTAVWTNVIGRLPNTGEQIIRLNAATQSYVTSTYDGVTQTWDIAPVDSVGVPGDAEFFNVGGVAFTPPPLSPVPEPTTATLAVLGLALTRVFRRRRV